jgi:hypothetical protein
MEMSEALAIIDTTACPACGHELEAFTDGDSAYWGVTCPVPHCDFELVELTEDEPEPERSCVRCGCTDEESCNIFGCYWVSLDPPICSVCATPEERTKERT